MVSFVIFKSSLKSKRNKQKEGDITDVLREINTFYENVVENEPHVHVLIMHLIT